MAIVPSNHQAEGADVQHRSRPDPRRLTWTCARAAGARRAWVLTQCRAWANYGYHIASRGTRELHVFCFIEICRHVPWFSGWVLGFFHLLKNTCDFLYLSLLEILFLYFFSRGFKQMEGLLATCCGHPP